MSWFTGLATYLVIWWIVLFAVLPWGVRPPETIAPGHADGAPEKPRLWLKAGVTTIVAAIVWVFVWWLATTDLISFRD